MLGGSLISRLMSDLPGIGAAYGAHCLPLGNNYPEQHRMPAGQIGIELARLAARLPGWLSQARGVAAPPHDGFAFVETNGARPQQAGQSLHRAGPLTRWGWLRIGRIYGRVMPSRAVGCGPVASGEIGCGAT